MILMTHAKWQETQDGYKLHETPYLHKGREARRIYLEWQWAEDGQMWGPSVASFIHPSARYGSQYIPHVVRPPSPMSDVESAHGVRRGISEPGSIDDDDL